MNIQNVPSATKRIPKNRPTLHRYHAWNGTSEEGTKRGMDGARERKEGLSERRKEGAGREGATERIEEQGRSEGSEQGRQGYF